MKKEELVSAIITTKNEESVIERLLVSLIKQSYKNVEIIVVDNNSVDSTKAIAKRYTNKVFNKGPERSVQRNFGVSKSNGKYLLILDADMQLSDNVIVECVSKAVSDMSIGAVIIPEVSVATNFWENVKAFERSFYEEKGDEEVEAARFFRKDAFKKVGGYDEKITGPEDWDLPESIKKLGYKQIRINAPLYHYERIKTPISIAKKKYYYALKSHRYLKKHSLSAFGPKTLYFLRLAFYRDLKKIFMNPILSLGMFVMLNLELVYGGAGFLIGKWTKK